MCDFFKARGINNPDRFVQLDRHHDIKQASVFGRECVWDVENAYRGVFVELCVLVAVQEPDFQTDNVRADGPGGLQESRQGYMLVRGVVIRR